MGKPGHFRCNGPEQITHAPRQAANRGWSHLPTCAAFRAVEQIEIWLLQSPLRGEHQNRFAGHTLLEQITHPLDTRAGFPRPCRTGNEEFRVEGRFDHLMLKRVEAEHEARVQERQVFVNRMTASFQADT